MERYFGHKSHLHPLNVSAEMPPVPGEKRAGGRCENPQGDKVCAQSRKMRWKCSQLSSELPSSTSLEESSSPKTPQHPLHPALQVLLACLSPCLWGREQGCSQAPSPCLQAHGG